MRILLVKGFRILFYCSIPIVSALLIASRQQEVLQARAVPAPTIRSEWDHAGKPVVVHEIKPTSALELKRLTVTMVDVKTANGWVTGDIHARLRTGQTVKTAVKDSVVTGLIIDSALEADSETGMYPVNIEFDSACSSPGTYLPVDVALQILDNVVTVPDMAVDISRDNVFVWLVKNNTAIRTPVTVGSRTDSGIVITSGLGAGDQVVVEGGSLLNEGDLVEPGVGI